MRQFNLVFAYKHKVSYFLIDFLLTAYYLLLPVESILFDLDLLKVSTNSTELLGVVFVVVLVARRICGVLPVAQRSNEVVVDLLLVGDGAVAAVATSRISNMVLCLDRASFADL